MSKQAMPIDTQQVVDTLTGAGVPGQQAKAHASVLSDALQDYDAQRSMQLCTKQELAIALAPIHQELSRLDSSIVALNAKIDATAARLDAKIDTTAAQLDAKLADAKSDLIRWIVSAGVLQSGLIAALVLNVAS